ncbi:Dihydroorotase [Pantoea sp. AS-PWVM4]|uniref:allantoinase n=1 Tax=Pantoea phytobeneficialis TaxID=2052056 RepID=A0AAP9H1L4_9GAMM|nr:MULTISPECIES: allantoinase AllB [Pantoea]ERK17089.1 Dihydroorotase [Pantoea sp. AS-PWVM4]MDO6408293.1 allantoinase AllB [Pantoea phytobeneficialis]QGR04942.1 allantoinase AllB [Pantoea phytobeneficialis]
MKQLIINGLVVTESGAAPADLLIEAGKISGILTPGAYDGTVDNLIDASGLIVLPGAIDVHTHFTGSHDFPEQELREGTRGAAAHGVTTIVEMPHSLPPATSLASFTAKRSWLAENCSVDYAMWAGLDGRNVHELAALDQAGALAFKAFLCSGAPNGDATDAKGLPRLDDDGLLRAMRELATFDGLIGVHAENHDILIGAGSELRRAGRKDIRAHALAGPEIAEIEAVGRVLAIAAETGARCHIVHVSSARAAETIIAAKETVRASFETCPHYLILDEEDLVRIGPNARCGPPIRPRPVVDALWQVLLRGDIDMIASDHCPYTPEQKLAGEFSIWDAGMGLTGVETLSPMFFSAAHIDRGLPLTEFARMTASGPAKAFRLWGKKGAIAPGFDADLVFYDASQSWTVSGENFQGLGKWSAFEGMRCQGKVVRTLIRGVTVYQDSQIQVEPGFGQFVTRQA